MSKSIYKSIDQVTIKKLLSECTTLETGCMHFGSINSSNYGTIRIDNKSYSVHRLMAKLIFGDPKPGYVVMHSCNHRACINPEHISYGTQSENILYAVKSGTHKPSFVNGEKCGKSKLSNQQVIEIRNAYSKGISSVILGKQYNVTKENIMAIVHRRTWKHLA